MWQRKQTIFLGLTSLCMVLTIFFPIWMATDNEVEKMLFPLHYTIKSGEIRNTIYFPYALCAVLAIASATIAATEIGKFENRLLQLKLGALNSILMAAAIGAGVYFATRLIRSNQLAGEYGLGLWLPAVAMISNVIANRFIRRDEKLVRDSDRLR
jgi:ABC-type thiamin/hydroxymethylpyrimidine transport system permease subunit